MKIRPVHQEDNPSFHSIESLVDSLYFKLLGDTSKAIETLRETAQIVAAVEEGRVSFTNLRKVVPYTLSNSFAEVLTIFVAMMLGCPRITGNRLNGWPTGTSEHQAIR